MKYNSPYDQERHESILEAIARERRIIAQHYRLIGKLQERLLKIGTPEEQASKRLHIRQAVIDIES